MARMDTTDAGLEQALAAEIRAEAARKGLSHKEIQQAAGITDRSFRRYFVEVSRPIPVTTVLTVAGVLGISASELFRRAEGGEVEPKPVKRPVARRVAARSVAPRRQPD